MGVRLRIYILLLSHTLSLSCSVSLPQARTWCVKWVSSSAWLFHAQAILCTPLSQAEDQAANLCHWLPCWITTRESSLPRCSAHTQTRTPARTIGPIVKLHCMSFLVEPVWSHGTQTRVGEFYQAQLRQCVEHYRAYYSADANPQSGRGNMADGPCTSRLS